MRVRVLHGAPFLIGEFFMAQIVDAVMHADTQGDMQDKYDDAVQEAEVALEEAYLALCKNGDAKSLIHFAPLDKALDYNRGPSSADMLQIILNASSGRNVQAEAINLRNRMAKTYAHYNVDIMAAEESLK
jgi:hypothetical protein